MKIRISASDKEIECDVSDIITVELTHGGGLVSKVIIQRETISAGELLELVKRENQPPTYYTSDTSGEGR